MTPQGVVQATRVVFEAGASQGRLVEVEAGGFVGHVAQVGEACVAAPLLMPTMGAPNITCAGPSGSIMRRTHCIA